MSHQIRPVAADELDAFRDVLSHAFNEDALPEETERFAKLFETERSFAGFDGDEMVATGGTFSLQLTVPGNVVPAGGTTMIAVKPTHRRRGLLRQMMRYHIDEVHGRGEPLAALWASDTAIYGRFGFGLASRRHEYTIATEHLQFHGSSPAKGEVRIADMETALPAMMAVYDAVAATRPGMYARREDWWRHKVLYDPERWRDGFSARRYALYAENGKVSGYTTYRVKAKWERGHGEGEVRVIELKGTSPEARNALWRYLVGIDLTTTLNAWSMPADDELPWRVVNPRRITIEVVDGLWVRPVDLPAALQARRYSAPGRLVLAVHDDFCPWNSGTWALESGPA